MNLVLLAVFDVLAGAYVGAPIGAPTRGVGERSFTDQVNNPESQFHAHPDDYELHEVGIFSMVDGTIVPTVPRPLCYGRARQFLRNGGAS